MSRPVAIKSETSPESTIGAYQFNRTIFPHIDEAFKEFTSHEFLKRPARQRFRRVNELLHKLISEAPQESFLLPAVVDYIDRINRLRILHEPYHLSLFEFWLNQLSELSDTDNYKIRSKIIGKFIPRDDYQAFFPIGMNKIFSGAHFVAAHLSPDVDTMVASFWGWVDAFGARVGSARHLWSLPGGPPDSPVTQIFYEMFGQAIFKDVARLSKALTLSAIDLVSQKGFYKRKGETSINAFDLIPGEKALILVDEQGHYQGEWHREDVDPIRQIIILFKSCLRWFENNLHVRLISFFAKAQLYREEVPSFLSSVFDVPIIECEPVQEFNERQKRDLGDFFSKVLNMPKGLESTFGDLISALSTLSITQLADFQADLNDLQHSELFDKSGKLREDRPAIFYRLEKLINHLDTAIHYVRDYAERLDVAISIKSKVLGYAPLFITMRSDIDDIHIMIKNKEFITVVVPEEDKLFPVGVVWASTLQQSTLGTVSFRDFCNQEEVKMASYLVPISVVDHHKASLKTPSPPMAIIGDAQSCNVLIAERTFDINDRYSLAGMTRVSLVAQIKDLQEAPHTRTNGRLMQRLLQRLMAADTRDDHFIHPQRELAEYLCFLHAILDDTDLLTKVSKRDIECVVQLLNRIKTIIYKKESEVVNCDDIPKDKNFVKTAAKRILSNSEMYSVYRKVFQSKEQEIEKNLSAEKNFESLFVDTKEQNGCCRVGQTKLFSINFPTYTAKMPQLLEYWVKKAEEVHREQPEIDLHIHMISTIPSSDEVYQDRVGHYQHQDQLWFWVPPKQRAYDHLSSFLTAMQAAHRFGAGARLEFLQSNEQLEQIFSRTCVEIPFQRASEGHPQLPVAILHFGAGLLNSRKAMVSPYLPRTIG